MENKLEPKSRKHAKELKECMEIQSRQKKNSNPESCNSPHKQSADNFKTLKDMEYFPAQEVGIVQTAQLKQEAIKRVKACGVGVGRTTLVRCGELKGNYCEACKLDMWVHNLTEEDLA